MEFNKDEGKENECNVWTQVSLDFITVNYVNRFIYSKRAR